MKRWLVLALGLGIAVIAGWSLLTGADPSGRSPVSLSSHAEAAPAESLHAEIDQASRDRLRAILREADNEGAKSP